MNRNRYNGQSPLSGARARAQRIVVITAAGAKTFSSRQLARLDAAGEVEFYERTEPLPAAELIDLVEGATVIAVTPRSVPDLSGDTLDALPSSVTGIAVFATGLDFVDLEAAAARGIAVSNLIDYSADSVAEHTIGLLLTLARRIHLSRDRVLGRVAPETSVRGWEVRGKTMGIVGAGRIGRRVMRLADALGMRVISTDRLLGGAGLNHVLGQSHVVSLHVPLRRGEPALIGHDEIAAMRPQSFLLNVSRAGLVDEEAAIGAVGSGQLAGYAVDDRIQNRERAARLIEEGRIVESGHTAWYSDEAIERGLEEWVANIVALADGRPASIALRHSEVV